MARTARHRALTGAALVAALAGTAGAQLNHKPYLPAREMVESPVTLGTIALLRTGPHGRPSHTLPPPTDTCNVLSSLTDANFGGGSFILEAGMAETEMAAATYTIAAAEFPITINLTEVILATSNTVVQTTTQWSMLFYSGTPTAGTLVATFSSDGVILPHAVIPPGTNGVNIQFSIDPSDPDQLIIPDNGTHKFTVAFRIDHHNNQTANPCFTAPPTNSNAFPCVDTSGVSSTANNWLFGVNCGSFGCPANGGWAPFSSLSAGLCRPSGDWVMRTTWSGVSCTPGVGACCKTDGTCQSMTTADCATAGGIYQGDGITCANANCPQPSAGCCFPNGNCITQTQSQCTGLGGTWLGVGISCNGSLCPTTGSCCLPNGTCTAGVTSAQCVSQNGVFRGLGTTCTGANCPDLRGACCTSSGCGLLTQGDCTTIGGSWQGQGTSCSTSCTGACCTSNGGCGVLTASDCSTIGGTWHGAGTTCPGACGPTCYANCDASTTVPFLNVLDFACFLNKFAASDTYANCDHSTTPPVLNVLDFSCFLNLFAAGCSAP